MRTWFTTHFVQLGISLELLSDLKCYQHDFQPGIR
jgi:hypothetical protein